MSTQKSISGIIGKGSIRHNNREFSAKNIDQNRTKDNIILCKENIQDAYHKLFDEALAEYNSKQKCKDRCIKDYYEHIRTSKQEKPFYKVIFQIGKKDDTAVGTEDGKQAAIILNEFYEKLQANNPHIHIFNAVIHMDEATPHLHIDFIPIATESKRGLSTRNSLSKALEESKLSGINSELDIVSKKKLQIKNLDKIPVENTMLGDKVKISKNDYTLLIDTSKKYYASKNRNKQLKSKITELQQENEVLKHTVSEQNKELSKLKSIREKLNIGQLQKELAEIKALLNKVMEFIDFMGLREKLEKFLQQSKYRNKNINR